MAGAAGLAVTLALMLGLGGVLGARRQPPEIRLAAGWGAGCVLLTLWGVLTEASLAIPLAALGAIGLLALIRPGTRGGLGGVGRMLALTLPLWLVLLALRPSQIDTWLNLLPNAAYLVDHGVLPTSTRPPSHSFLPVAPYNTQFVAYAASVVAGSFAESAMALFNVALVCAAALLLARVVANGTADTDLPPGWRAASLGFLLAIALNPGFVPRVFFASYGEAPLAVTALFAVWLAAATLDRLAKGEPWPGSIAALALVLAAMVNIKQSGLGLVLPVGGTMLALALVHPAIKAWRGCAVVAATLAPALLLYLVWRPFAESSFAEGELKMLPAAAWNWGLIPQILGGMGFAAWEKATYFITEVAVVAIAVVTIIMARRRRVAWSRDRLILGMAAGTIAVFTLFILFTYIAHFPPDWAVRAHSFFRYSAQLSLVVMLALTVAVRPRVLQLPERAWRGASMALPILVLVLPLLLVRVLRFDLDPPQPDLWRIGIEAAERIGPDARIALLLPGDEEDSVGSFMRGVLLFAPPRRPSLDLRVETGPVPEALDRATRDGFGYALITCTPGGLAAVPPGLAALLKHDPDGWTPIATWTYPPDLARRHFSAMLAHGPVCAGAT